MLLETYTAVAPNQFAMPVINDMIWLVYDNPTSTPHPGLMLLETYTAVAPNQLAMPDFLTVKREVTGESRYTSNENRHVATHHTWVQLIFCWVPCRRFRLIQHYLLLKLLHVQHVKKKPRLPFNIILSLTLSLTISLTLSFLKVTPCSTCPRQPW